MTRAAEVFGGRKAQQPEGVAEMEKPSVTTSVVVGPRSRGREEAVEFRLIFAAAYGIFLAAALVGRLLPRQWRARRAGPVAGGRGASVFGEARAATNTFVPFAFMA